MDAVIRFPAKPALSTEHEALFAALSQVLEPLAELCVRKGVTIQPVEELLRGCFVKAARAAHGDSPGQRLTSRISTATGLTRREVTRLERQTARRRNMRRSPVTELFTRWLSDPALRTADGQPAVLPRQGPMPSFEALAQSVTRDVHPRTLLDELCRVKLTEHDGASDTVRVLREAFVPQGDWARMIAFLGDNVGDHLRAASANVLDEGQQHLEQAIYADELSEGSLQAACEFMSQHWRSLLATVVPRLESLMADDRAAGREQNYCLRIGLFTWSQPMAGAHAKEKNPALRPGLNPNSEESTS